MAPKRRAVPCRLAETEDSVLTIFFGAAIARLENHALLRFSQQLFFGPTFFFSSAKETTCLPPLLYK
jgi:hypothetical protein